MLLEKSKSGLLLDKELFIKTVSEICNINIKSEFEKYIEDGKDFPLIDFFEENNLLFTLESFKNQNAQVINIPQLVANRTNLLILKDKSLGYD